MRRRLLAWLLCMMCSVCSAHPINVVPAYDDDELADYFQQHVALGSGTIHWQVLHPQIAIADRDNAPLLVIAALWGGLLGALGIALWRERKRSKVVQ